MLIMEVQCLNVLPTVHPNVDLCVHQMWICACTIFAHSNLAQVSDAGWDKLKEVVDHDLISKNTKCVQLPDVLLTHLKQGSSTCLICLESYASWLSITDIEHVSTSEAPAAPAPATLPAETLAVVEAPSSDSAVQKW